MRSAEGDTSLDWWEECFGRFPVSTKDTTMGFSRQVMIAMMIDSYQ